MRVMSIAYIVAMVFGLGGQVRADDLKWHTSYLVALQESRDTGKPLLVAFRCIP
jgi:hypothetical protein